MNCWKDCLRDISLLFGKCVVKIPLLAYFIATKNNYVKTQDKILTIARKILYSIFVLLLPHKCQILQNELKSQKWIPLDLYVILIVT